MSTHGSARARRRAAAAAVVAFVVTAGLAAAAASAFAGGDYGPDTCLNGYVWRGAVSSDHVCVTPDVQDEIAQDNAQGAARRSPTGGAYGPDTCLQGYVWRDALAGDQVCVTPAARDQARSDNLEAATRRNELRTVIRTWRPNAVRCDGDVCTTNNDDAPRYRLLTDRINVGQALIILVRTDGSRPRQIWHRWVSVRAHPTAPGGLLSYRTDQLQCDGAPNAYFRVMDGSSGRWSSRQAVSIGCATL